MVVINNLCFNKAEFDAFRAKIMKLAKEGQSMTDLTKFIETGTERCELFPCNATVYVQYHYSPHNWATVEYVDIAYSAVARSTLLKILGITPEYVGELILEGSTEPSFPETFDTREV